MCYVFCVLCFVLFVGLIYLHVYYRQPKKTNYVDLLSLEEPVPPAQDTEEKRRLEMEKRIREELEEKHRQEMEQ